VKFGSRQQRTAAWAGIELWAKRLGAVVAIVGVVSTAVVFALNRAGSVLGNEPDVGVDVSLVVVGDGSSSGLEDVPAKAMPRLDITVRNTGTETVLLTGARITIESSTSLRTCRGLPFTGPSWVPVSQAYPINLPVSPTREERVVSRPLHDQIPPGEVDRPLLAFQATPRSEGEGLYALNVQLLTDQGDVNVGRFVVAVPRPPFSDGVALPPSGSAPGDMPSPGSPSSSTAWCFRRNLDAIERVAAEPGQRSTKVAALADLPTPDQWAGSVGSASARAAAERMLGVGAEDAELATYAAEGAGDPAFLAEARQRGAAMLVARAEGRLNEAGASASSAETSGERAAQAVFGLRTALDLAPSSSQADGLLQRAEDQLRLAEEQIR
jgi:hypothetical protein